MKISPNLSGPIIQPISQITQIVIKNKSNGTKVYYELLLRIVYTIEADA